HRDLVVLTLNLHGLGGSAGSLGAGLTGQLAEGDGLLLPLLVGLVVLLAALGVLIAGGLGLLGLGSGLGSLLLRLGGLLGLGLLLGGLGLAAVQKVAQIRLAVGAAELLQQVVQLVLLQGGAVLLAGASHGGQLLQDLLDGLIDVFCKIDNF